MPTAFPNGADRAEKLARMNHNLEHHFEQRSREDMHLGGSFVRTPKRSLSQFMPSLGALS